ncbi:hypothetical protein G6F46_009317 [Rhizopus delemar]|uniref:Uncharacterized protein n=2 Tax=Rhizopus TaxID=4842 RepID=A0A9P6YX49_9FUNG|nr:hypothetical protein G6F55_008255 [Rhizopus delemar]KAG1538930.1 hypothetical protein G6F51_009460 [Rhizopus arrhizus]KAG1493064.1 hypothetical protein G6F54_008855 [Rhizopus delemar]KAG1507109.1 hypothetical protein G6F53_009196 [Rhizopus delemar]KAG1522493.1 hypothetical protein G6F52_005811 [Rhizopus delemar]
MSYTVDQIVNEIRNYHRTVSDMRSEFQAWKDEVRQEIAELKLMVERNTFINHPAPQAAIYQPQPSLLDIPAFGNVLRDIPRFPTSLGDGRHSNAACIDGFLRETMDLVDNPEDSEETLDHKRLLVKRYHTQLNRITQVVSTNLSNKLLADAHIDKNKISWRDIPAVYKSTAFKELEELALQANIPLNRCINSWGAQVLLVKSYNNYRNKLKNKLSNTTSNLVEQIDDTNSEENLDFELLPDLDASNELEEGNSNEINIATSSSSAVPPLPPSPPSPPRTRSGARPTSHRQNKKRRI